MTGNIVTGSVLSEVQDSLRDILSPSTKPEERGTGTLKFDERLALAKEIRKLDCEIGKQKAPTGTTSSLIVGTVTGTVLSEVENDLLTDFRNAVQGRNANVANVIGLAKEIRKYERDINKQKKNAPPADLL